MLKCDSYFLHITKCNTNSEHFSLSWSFYLYLCTFNCNDLNNYSFFILYNLSRKSFVKLCETSKCVKHPVTAPIDWTFENFCVHGEGRGEGRGGRCSAWPSNKNIRCYKSDDWSMVNAHVEEACIYEHFDFRPLSMLFELHLRNTCLHYDVTPLFVVSSIATIKDKTLIWL